MTTLVENIARFPAAPGVYLMKDDRGRIIYVGKAKNLKVRVRQYLNQKDTRYQIEFLMARVATIDFIETHTESEALLVENSLIKKHKPRYNVFLKDDKTYLGLRLTLQDDFPKLQETRKIRKDGSAYYGPFTSAEKIRDVKEFIYRHFLLRTCSDREMAQRTRPCLEYQIGRCTAPCVDLVTKESYAVQVKSVRDFLEGRSKELQTEAKKRMAEASQRLDYEGAARYRDLLKNMQELLEKQNVTQLSFDFMDILALRRAGEKVGIAILMVRDGTLFDAKYLVLTSLEDDRDALVNTLMQYYSEQAFIPSQILVPFDLEDDHAVLEKLLSERAGSRVVLRVPQKGEKRELLELATQNLISHFDTDARASESKIARLDILRAELHLKNQPLRIETIDTSHHSGSQAVAAMICFVNGEPCKSDYRLFNMRTEKSNDDYAMMYETLSRRFAKYDSGWELPQLLLVDGGKGQLGIAVSVLNELGLADKMDIVAIAKGRGPGARGKGLWTGKKEEEIFLPGRKNPVILKRGSASLLLLQHIRDEAHRFAITAHRRKKAKSVTKSWLDDIPGIGPKTKMRLLKIFGSPEAVRNASLDSLRNAGISQKIIDMIQTP